MKQNDLAALVIIIAMVSIVSWFAAGALIGQPKNNRVEVEQVSPISANFPAPDARIFNDTAIDPTVEIEGSSPANNQPFGN